MMAFDLDCMSSPITVMFTPWSTASPVFTWEITIAEHFLLKTAVYLSLLPKDVDF